MTSELCADDRGYTGRFALPPIHWQFWWELPSVYRRSFAYWRTLPAKLAPIPTNLREFARRHSVSAIICNHYFNLPFATRLRALCPSARILLETHDLQSLHYVDDDLKHPLTGKPQLLPDLLSDELEIARQADVLIHLSEHEAKEFSVHLTERPHFTIFPDCPRNYTSATVARHCKDRFDFLIVADGNNPNYRSLCWFLDNVWSEELQRRCSLKIVGAIDRRFDPWKDPRYVKYRECFLGRVSDAAPYYRSAGTVLLPTIAGHGVSMKTVEAISFGKPIIATPLAFRGFERHVPEGLRAQFSTSAEEFRRQLLEAAGRDPKKSDPQSISLYERLFTPESRLARFSELLSV